MAKTIPTQCDGDEQSRSLSSAKPSVFATIELAAQAGALDHPTATLGAWPAHAVANGDVRVEDALLPEEKELLNKPGRSDQHKLAMLEIIVSECIAGGKPLPALVERYDLATTGARALRDRGLKVKDGGAALVANFQRLRGERVPVKRAAIETAAAFNVSTKTVQRYCKRQREQKSRHL